MRQTIMCLALGACLLVVNGFAQAQPRKTVPRVAFLFGVALSANTARIDAFKQGLRALGYKEGENIIVDYRTADGNKERLAKLVDEVVSRKVDVIVTAGSTPTRPARAATATIPIVMAQDSDPVGNGFVKSLARPGGNITGLSTLAPEISGKQIELLKEMVPTLARVVVIGSSTTPGTSQRLQEIERASNFFGVGFQFVDVPAANDIVAAFPNANKGRADAVLVLASPINFSQQAHIVELARRNRLPAIYPEVEYMESGGLLYYGANTPDLFRRAATYVDKILKGAKPADLPVEQPRSFEFIVSLIAAKQIGLTIPPDVLARADRVIR